jgi:ABC-type transporter Mla subunit MlaD
VSAEARYFRVGLFVFLGMAAIVAAVIVLGGRSLLSEPTIFESYFDESVEGLAVGSPVKLRGVEIGRVAQIGFVQDHYHFGSDEERVTAGNKVLVRMEVTPRRGGSEREVEEELERLVARGLRLQLSRSALTGTSFLQADFFDPAKHPLMEIGWQPEVLYIPSTPSTLAALSSAADRLLERLEDLRVEEIVTNLNELLGALTETVKSLDLPELKEESTSLLADLRRTSAELRGAVSAADLPELASRLGGTADQASAALEKVGRAVDGGRYDLEMTLENLRVTSENLRELSDTLRAQPSLLLRGAPPERGIAPPPGEPAP